MYIRALSTLLLPADQVEETVPKMDKNIALEALSALTGFTVKPRPAGGALLPRLMGGFQASGPLLNSQTTPPPNELTIENLISTIICNETFQSPLKNDMDINMEEFLSPEYDKGFRGSKDPSKCYRGGELYTRPWGWYRFALKVKDKYPDGNTWLGFSRRGNMSSPGEWPVSFHGTGLQGAEGITKRYYEPGSRALYGYGIYSTPDITIAAWNQYAKKFTSKTDGKTYKVVMQNRINPKMRKIIREKKDYWLIEIDPNATPEEVKKISTESIRPYGILIKEV